MQTRTKQERIAVVLVLGTLCAACEEEAAPVYTPKPAQDGSGDSGTTNSGGTTGGSGGNGDSGTTNSGGTTGGSGGNGTNSAAAPGDAMLSTFSAGSVYMIGRIGNVAQEVICDPASPDSVSGYLPDNTYFHQISPLTGKLFYVGIGGIGTFEPEAIPFDVDGYPMPLASPESNDDKVKTSECDSQGVDTFFLNAQSGLPYFSCQGGEWYGPTGAYAPCVDDDNPYALSIDGNGAVLCTNFVIDSDGVARPMDLPSVVPSSVVLRAKPGGGFWAVVEETPGYSRWSITADGLVSRDGEYAPAPDGKETSIKFRSVLDGDGAYYAWRGSNNSPEALVRFSGNLESSTVIYDVADDPFCKVSEGWLVTGP